jgi:hypothetical protein
MFLATVSNRARSFSLRDAESDSEQQRLLAASIHQHFRVLAEVLLRAAELCGDTAEGERLRAAASAAEKGKHSAERLGARLNGGEIADTELRPRTVGVP